MAVPRAATGTHSTCLVRLSQRCSCLDSWFAVTMQLQSLPLLQVRCGLTQQVMADPVTAADGCNYERGAIEGKGGLGLAASNAGAGGSPAMYLLLCETVPCTNGCCW